MSSKIQHWNSEFSLLPTENTSQNSFGYGIIRKIKQSKSAEILLEATIQNVTFILLLRIM